MIMISAKYIFSKMKKSKIRKIDAIKLFQVLIYSISVVTFFYALNYFSGRSSIDVFVSSSPTGFYMDTVQEFYKKNNIEIPKILIEDKSLSKLFKTETISIPENYINIGAGTSDFRLINAIRQGQMMGGYIKLRTEELEHQIGRHTYKKMFYVYGDSRGFYPEEDFKKILNYIKPQLSREDYFVFLSALIFSREITNEISITNNGDVDLKKIEVIIPSPLGKITESRENNILSINVTSTLPHNIRENIDNINIYLARMKKNESLGLSIITRENQIEKDEISTFFNEVKEINIGKVMIAWFIILFLMGLSALYFKGNDGSGSK